VSTALPTAPLGRTKIEVTRLGLGTAPLGGWPTRISPEDGHATILAAWEAGVRYFDTAPLYGYGRAERWLGAALAELPRAQVVVSTKVGRVIRPARPGESQLFEGAGDLGTDFDFSRDAVLRSIDESLERMALDRVDIVLIHDPDDHIDDAAGDAFTALDRLRHEGVVGAIGAGMNFPGPLAELVRRTDLDCVLLAGRYSLLEHDALEELLPLLDERRVSMIVGGAFNTGILADPSPGTHFHYVPADDLVLARARTMQDICRRGGVALGAAALQFPLAHPSVAAVVTGARSPGEIEQNARLISQPVPAQVWDELVADGHLPPGAPLPR
jgi:D-threo-aldose 1-dehydrogenase